MKCPPMLSRKIECHIVADEKNTQARNISILPPCRLPKPLVLVKSAFHVGHCSKTTQSLWSILLNHGSCHNSANLVNDREQEYLEHLECR
jgi:hypothetical protein